LIRGVRRLGFLPDTNDLSDADILEFADEETVTLISAAIKTERDEHYVTYQDIPLTGTVRVFPIPTRAMGRTVRGVTLLTQAGVSVPCPTIDPVHGWDGLSSPSLTAYSHYITADSISFPSNPPTGWTLRVWYLRRPSNLIKTNQALAIQSASDALTLNTVATDTSIVSQFELIDIVRGQVPFGCLYTDRIVSNLSSFEVDLDPTTPIDPGVIATRTGVNSLTDWICPAETTCFPQVPAEFWSALEAAVGVRCMEAIGDSAAVQTMSNTYARRVKAAIDITSPRNEEGGRAIVRRSSPLRSGGWGFSRFRGRGR
jgi:hypothetical protein